jgi:hypothetical protein
VKAALVLVAAAAGCAQPWSGWDDAPTAHVTAGSDLPAFAAPWRAQVERDVGTWNAELTAIGCPAPFEIAAGGHPVTLVPVGTWGADSAIAGMTDSERIRVQVAWIVIDGEVLPHPVILLHELGHALGLGHADAINGPAAMTPEPTSDTLQPRDVAAAACVMGCGSCDQSDPFDD